MVEHEKAARLVGPFRELLTLNDLPLKGRIQDESLEIIKEGGIVTEGGIIRQVGPFPELLRQYGFDTKSIQEITESSVCLPGFIDAHTHMCFAGSRCHDYAMRVAGKPYLEIAKAGGGILDTVSKTRAASQGELEHLLWKRCDRQFSQGITTCEVKSGYGLEIESELKMLRAINVVGTAHVITLVPTCLAAHMPPKDRSGGAREYLEDISENLLPRIRAEALSNRIDIFIEDSAFTIDEARAYLSEANHQGFELTAHVDQFTPGGSLLAVELQAMSADHLEASTEREIKVLARSDVVAMVLPGASLGLGSSFAPARQLLDQGACVAIATDWNPGSAPMGDLLLQAAIMGASEKLSAAETFAGITFRAAAALGLSDRGILAARKIADFVVFPCDDFREILYHQGSLKPSMVWKNASRSW